MMQTPIAFKDEVFASTEKPLGNLIGYLAACTEPVRVLFDRRPEQPRNL